MKRAFGRAIVAAAIAACLTVAAPASADVRYAAPEGGTTEPCNPTPCSLDHAVESASSGDEVIVLAGDYTLAAADPVEVLTPLTIHGVDGFPLPMVSSNGSAAFIVFNTAAGSTIRDLRINGSNPPANLLNFQAPGTAERVQVYASSMGSTAVRLADGAVLRDSIAAAIGADGAAINSAGSGATLFNVTAMSFGDNSSALFTSSGFGAPQMVTVRNTILRGVAFDISTNAAAPGDITISADHSNFASLSPDPNRTFNDLGANQTAMPALVAPEIANFHQRTDSVTIDAGVADAGLGSIDIDGDPRSVGSAPDIGADEFVPAAAPPPASDTFPPDTKITDGPKKKTRKRNVKFEFGGSEPGVTFECQLDDNGFEPCSSPVKLKGLGRGKHVFEVRAVDVAGNADPTPADRRWKVTKKKRKKKG